MHPSRIRDGVHQGVIDGGNQSGIPWARGFERFDERYIGKPLVYCGTVGRIPRLLQDRPSERKEIFPGDVIVMCGGRIGKDGIHGATFSSEELRKESPAQAVQIGDPITQRKMYEFLIEARDLGLYRAHHRQRRRRTELVHRRNEPVERRGGSRSGESAAEIRRIAAMGDLSLRSAGTHVAGRAAGETGCIAGARGAARSGSDRAREPLPTAALWLCATAIAWSPMLDLDFLHEGGPRMLLEARWQPPQIPSPEAAAQRICATGSWPNCSGRLNVCSKEFKSRQYDGEVKGLSVVKPFVGVHSDVPSDATVMLVEHGCREGIVLAEGINPFLFRPGYLPHDGERHRRSRAARHQRGRAAGPDRRAG